MIGMVLLSHPYYTEQIRIFKDKSADLLTGSTKKHGTKFGTAVVIELSYWIYFVP